MKKVQAVSLNSSYRDKMLSSFIIGIGFWLINISHTSSSPWWNSITALTSAISFIFLLGYSFKAARQGDKVGWAYFVTDICMIISYLIFVVNLTINF